LMAIDASSGAIEAWDSRTSGAITSIVFSGPTMYVGGIFTSTGGQPRNNVAALDPITGAATSWDPGADGEVSAIAVSGDVVYLGGTFTSVAGKPRHGLAAVSASTAAVLDWMPLSSAVSLGRIRAAEATSTAVFMGGDNGLAILEAAR